MEDKLNRNGWEDCSAVVAIEPELENWIWTPSPYTANALEWDAYDELWGWLKEESHIEDGQLKPKCPKNAMRAASGKKNTAFSSSIFKSVAGRAQFRNCEDGAFRKFIATLQNWFPLPDCDNSKDRPRGPDLFEIQL